MAAAPFTASTSVLARGTPDCGSASAACWGRKTCSHTFGKQTRIPGDDHEARSTQPFGRFDSLEKFGHLH